MNRRQRRVAVKTSAKIIPPAPVAEPIEKPSSPGIGLRVAASLLLSSWMLKRVHNPQVLVMLRAVAVQAGRGGVVRQLDERIKHSS